MAFRAAYGLKASIQNAIGAGIIPEGCLIVTKDEAASGELYLYTPQGELKEISYKNKFRSMEDAFAWVKQYDCAGNIISISDGDSCAAYIVQPDKRLELIAGQESILEYQSMFEFPTIGKPNRLYIALDENDGQGAVYRWDLEAQKYFKPEPQNSGGGIQEGTVLVGGGAFE